MQRTRFGLLLVAAAVVLLPAAASAKEPEITTLSISPIRAVFSETDRATTYTVKSTDVPGLQPVERWSLSLEPVDPTLPIDPPCDNHGVLGGGGFRFVWHHGNTGDPVHDDHCDHAKQGKYGHQGLITVRVTDARGRECVATYKGTNSSTDSSVADGVATQPTCGAKSYAGKCQCLRMTARILPASLRVTRSNQFAPTYLRFTVHWTLTCLGGSGGCEGAIDAVAPQGKGYDTQWDIGMTRIQHLYSFSCGGDCGGVREGTQGLKLDLRSGMNPIQRSDESIPIVLKPTCQGRAVAPIRLRVAFDSAGEADPAHSKLR